MRMKNFKSGTINNLSNEMALHVHMCETVRKVSRRPWNWTRIYMNEGWDNVLSNVSSVAKTIFPVSTTLLTNPHYIYAISTSISRLLGKPHNLFVLYGVYRPRIASPKCRCEDDPFVYLSVLFLGIYWLYMTELLNIAYHSWIWTEYLCTMYIAAVNSILLVLVIRLRLSNKDN